MKHNSMKEQESKREHTEMRRMKGMITTRRMCGVMLNGDFAMERKQTTTGKIWEVG